MTLPVYLHKSMFAFVLQQVICMIVKDSEWAAKLEYCFFIGKSRGSLALDSKCLGGRTISFSFLCNNLCCILDACRVSITAFALIVLSSKQLQEVACSSFDPMKLREVKLLSLGYIASKFQTWESNMCPWQKVLALNHYNPVLSIYTGHKMSVIFYVKLKLSLIFFTMLEA